MKTVNEMRLVFDSKSINERFSRVAVGSFISCLDPTVEELTDIKTAVSEAVTNCIVHGYREQMGKIYITVSLTENNTVKIKIRDFSVMESFMDKVRVVSKLQKGTTVTLIKAIGGKSAK